MHILLTGGYGCIGCWIIRLLLARGQSVSVFDLKEDTRRLKQVIDTDQLGRVRFVQGDVSDMGRLKEVIRGEGITQIIHLAGLQVPTCRADPLLGAKVNVLGTLAVFEAAKQSEGKIQRVVYA